MIVWQILVSEVMKLRHSSITWLTWLASAVMPLADALFVWVVKAPGRAASFGLLGTKAEIAGVTPDWTGFFALLRQTEVAGLILVAVIAAYVFGREYADGTAKTMLTLPIGRHWFAAAKLVVVFLWFAVLTVLLVAEGLIVAWFLDIPGFSIALAVHSVGAIFLIAFVIWLLVPVVAWIAILGRGYLAPLGFTIFMLVMANVVEVIGWGKWFPWSMVTMLAGVIGQRSETLATGSIVILAATFVAGFAAMLLQLRYADNTQ